MGKARARHLTDADKKAAAKVRELWASYKKKHRGMSQDKAAELAGMTQSAFSQFVLGRVPMRVTPVVKLAKLFGVPPTDIRDDLPDLVLTSGKETSMVELKTSEPVPPGYTPSPEALDLARVFDTLQPQTKSMFREQIYLYAILDHSYPWLRRGRPKGESYDAFEKRHIENMKAQLALEAERISKIKR